MFYFLVEENIPHYCFYTFPKRDLKLKRKQGGSCPILYALKGLDDLKLSHSQKTIFFERIKKKIKNELLKEIKQKIDYVIYIPSSHTISYELAILLAKKFNANILSLFEKTNIQMKNVPLNERNKQKPLSLKNQQHIDLDGKNILIVDDLIASGTTMKNAIELLKNLSLNSKINKEKNGILNKNKTKKADLNIKIVTLFKTEC